MHLIHLLRYVWSHPLNRHARLKAIARVFRWQIASRLLPNTVIGLPFVNDSKLFMRRGMTGATGNWYCGLHESDEMGFILHLLRPGDLFLDIGANIGSYSVLAAAGTGASVVAIEPIAETFGHLTANIRLNQLESQVQAHRIGISNQCGVLRFTISQDTVNHVLAPGENAEADEVEVSTMDMLMAGRTPTAIKIDVEGHELAVIEGAAMTLSALGLIAVIMETNGSGARYGVDDRQLFEIMKKHGFEAWSYCAINRSLSPFVISTQPSQQGNTIFLRDIGEAKRRIAGAGRTRLINGWI